MYTRTAQHFAAFAAAAVLVFALSAFASVQAAYADSGQALQAGSIAPQATKAATADEGDDADHEDGWEKVGKSWYYWQDGKRLDSQWLVTDDAPAIAGDVEGEHRYWLDEDGKLARKRLIDPTSERDDGAKYWAYATKGGYVATGKTRVGKKVYLANKKGRLEQGDEKGFLVTKKYDKRIQRYLIDKKAHAAITGKVIKVKGYGKVFAQPKKGYVTRGVVRVDSKHVLLADDDGKLKQKQGWYVSRKYSESGELQRYWLEPTKKYKNVYGARTGNFKVDGQKYFAEADGTLFRNAYKQLKSGYYWANDDGALIKNEVVSRMVSMAQGYSSPSQYLIMVDTDDTKLIVFEGAQDAWNVKFIWDCSTGAPETPTILGVYSVGLKGYSFGESHGYSCYYWTQWCGDYLFHTRIYHANTHDLMDVSMNTRVSQGCVRLYDEDAYWIWTNVPTGTTVVTME